MKRFAENLMTPHIDIAKAGVSPEELLESARFLTISAAYDVSEKTYEDQVEAAYDTARLVRQSLRFESYAPSESTADSWLTPAYLAMDRRTNCHGYSIVLSECLDEVGVPHYVAFANQHSFVVLQSDDGARTNLIDTPVKELHVEIDGAIAEPSLSSQVEQGTSAANKLFTDKVLAQSGFTDKEKALYKHPWMSFRKMDRGSRSFSMKNDEAEAYDTRLMLRTYQPEQGRQVLEAYANFVLAVRRSKFMTAHDHLQGLDGEYPDVDRRNRFQPPTRLVRHLGSIGEITKALGDIEIVEHSLWATDDLVVHLWPADERRHLGFVSSNPSLVSGSIEEYEAIMEERQRSGGSTEPIDGRLLKAKKQWATLRRE